MPTPPTPRLPPDALREFDAAYFEAFGTTLPATEVEAMANRLVDFALFIASILEQPSNPGA